MNSAVMTLKPAVAEKSPWSEKEDMALISNDAAQIRLIRARRGHVAVEQRMRVLDC